MSSLSNSISRSRSMSRLTNEQVDRLGLRKAAGSFGIENLTPQASSFFEYGSNISRRKYAQFRGYVYAAVNALASEGASQPVQMGRTANSSKKRNVNSPKDLFHLFQKMPTDIRMKASTQEMKLITSDPMLDLLNRPNQVQYKYQFVYTFIANLCLTGFAYIVAGEDADGKPELYALPTSWVKVSHRNGPYSAFKIVDPKNPSSESGSDTLDRSQVAFAMLPNPSDPLQGFSPANGQSAAISIDEKIQASQVEFFDNGIFPTAVITVGHNPHPDVPGGLRPRLNAAQRRQVYGAIKKLSSGIGNYGNPAIVDGLIEKIEKFSNTQPEMGWEKSEKTIRSRILSAFGVHPFILGEEMVGSYAQAFVTQDRFAKKVNVFLDLLSSICTDFVPGLFGLEKQGNLLWFEKMAAVDPTMLQDLWIKARANGDVSQNELRAYMGLAPDEDSNEAYVDRLVAPSVINVATGVTKGLLDPKQGVAILKAIGLPTNLAEEIAGDGLSDEAALARLETAIGTLGNNEPPKMQRGTLNPE